MSKLEQRKGICICSSSTFFFNSSPQQIGCSPPALVSGVLIQCIHSNANLIHRHLHRHTQK